MQLVRAVGRPGWTTAGEAGRAELVGLMEAGVAGILTDVPGEVAALRDDIEAIREGSLGEPSRPLPPPASCSEPTGLGL